MTGSDAERHARAVLRAAVARVARGPPHAARRSPACSTCGSTCRPRSAPWCGRGSSVPQRVPARPRRLPGDPGDHGGRLPRVAGRAAPDGPGARLQRHAGRRLRHRAWRERSRIRSRARTRRCRAATWRSPASPPARCSRSCAPGALAGRGGAVRRARRRGHRGHRQPLLARRRSAAPSPPPSGWLTVRPPNGVRSD